MTDLTQNSDKRLRPARGDLATAVLIMADRMAAAERRAAIHHCYDPDDSEKVARLDRSAARRSRALSRLVFALAEANR
jgi:hypothetical protein